MPGGEGDKSAAGLLITGSYPPDAGLRVDFVNSGQRSLKVALGLFVAPARTYYESPVLTLPPGYSTHTLPLDKPVWKSRKTGWRYEAVPKGLDRTVQLDILVYTSEKAVLLLPYLQPPVKPQPADQTAPVPGPASEAAEEDTVPDGGILSPAEEQRLKDKLTPEQKEEIRRLITSLER
jgi:hypothetical protein